jgi:dipeptidyl aminopeptidase/acylaminoacyl peptidase
MSKSTHAALAICMSLVSGFACVAPARSEQRPIDARAAVESARFMVFQDVWAPRESAIDNHARKFVEVSPRGDKFVVRVVRGDVERNGIWLELYAGSVSGRPAEVRRVARLFADGLERPPFNRRLAHDVLNPISWRDDRTVSFRWEDSHGTAQVVAVDIETAKLTWLTQSRADVLEFTLGPGNRVAYLTAAEQLRPAVAEQDQYGGEYVSAYDGYSLVDPRATGQGLFLDRKTFEAFLVSGADTVKLNLPFQRGVEFLPRFSPDGRWAVLERMVRELPAEWSNYDGVRDSTLDRSFRTYLAAPSQMRVPIGEFVVMDASTGKLRRLWDRPNVEWNREIAWSPDNRWLLVPQALPSIAELNAGSRSLVPLAIIDVATGDVAVPVWANCTPPASDAHQVPSWQSRSSFTVTVREARFRFERRGEAWRCLAREPVADLKKDSAEFPVEVIEDLNEPPRLYRRTATGRQLLLDPNPELSKRALGRVELITWPNPVAGRAAARGWLYYPVGYQPGKRYPLVIQLTGGAVASSQFSLHGRPDDAGLGPGASVYAAQMLAGRGMMVLGVSRIVPTPADTHEARLVMQSAETAIRRLDDRGMVDIQRVGLAGFSRSGWIAEYGISHREHPYAAAITADSTEAGYMNAALLPGYGDTENGSSPYGTGLRQWLENAPTFSVERIRTPLRIIKESGDRGRLLFKWELFARMRALNLPVEYYDVPNRQGADHGGQNPIQSLSQKEGAVDWFDFWLNDHEDPDATKAAQYARWRKLREQRDEALKQPRPPLLKWTATALEAGRDQTD